MRQEKRLRLWKRYPKVREMFEAYNGVLQEEEDAWERLVEQAGELREEYRSELDEILRDTVMELDKISRKRKGDL